jgi:hypothetical protein
MLKQKKTVFTLVCVMTLSQPLFGGEISPDQQPAAPAASADDPMAAMQARWRERDARYRDLVERAKEMGVVLPEDPPWKAARNEMMSDMAERRSRHQTMMSMSPQERMAAREAERQAMQERAKARAQAPSREAAWASRDDEWARHQAVIDAMSDEERAACHAMHRRHMERMMYQGPQRPMMQGPGMMGPGTMGPGTMGPGTMGPGTMGQGRDASPMGPGYGYGANPYGPRNFWDPNQ